MFATDIITILLSGVMYFLMIFISGFFYVGFYIAIFLAFTAIILSPIAIVGYIISKIVKLE